MSGISYAHKVRGVSDPTHAFIITQLLMGIRKKNPSVDKRKPITESLLAKLVNQMDILGFPAYDKSLFKAMFLSAFYFGLRVGEITVSPHNIQRDQLKVSSSKISLVFSSYKHAPAHPDGHTIQARDSVICVVRALSDYVSLRGDKPGALFLLGNKPVPSRLFSSHLKLLITTGGDSSVGFTSHSFRIGAATYWANKGLSDAKIRSLGRWRSNANTRYIRGAVDHTLQ